MAVRKVSNNNKECDVIQDYELKVIYIYETSDVWCI